MTDKKRIAEIALCGYCHNARVVGWSGAGPILCPVCSSGEDELTVIARAWREQRMKVHEVERENTALIAELRASKAECERLRDTFKEEHVELLVGSATLREERDATRARLARAVELLHEANFCWDCDDGDICEVCAQLELSADIRAFLSTVAP